MPATVEKVRRPVGVNRKAAHDAHWIPPHAWTEHGMQNWAVKHLNAIAYTAGPIAKMFTGWVDYANLHAARYEDGIGQDYVLGPEWEAVGKALLGLLNGECGELDCGTLDCIIRHTLKAEGYESGL